MYSARNIRIHLNFDDSVEDTHKVERIHMDDYMLKRLPPGFGENVPNLKHLWAWRGSIAYIERGTFKNIKNLNSLEISHNKIEHLPSDVFGELDVLTELRLENNPIKKLPKNVLSNLKHLTFLSFSRCKLIYLSKDLFANNLQIDTIWLYENQLSLINVDFTLLPSITEISLLKNICIDDFFNTNSLNTSRWTTVQDFQRIINLNCTEISLSHLNVN